MGWTRLGQSTYWHMQKTMLRAGLVKLLRVTPARLWYPLVCIKTIAEVGWAKLNRQLLLPVCKLASAGERPNLTPYWLVHTRVRFEVTPGEVCLGTSQLDYCTQT